MYTCESFLFRNLVPLTCGQMKATERERGCKIDEGKTIMLARNEWKSGIDVSVRKNVVCEKSILTWLEFLSRSSYFFFFFFFFSNFFHSFERYVMELHRKVRASMWRGSEFRKQECGPRIRPDGGLISLLRIERSFLYPSSSLSTIANWPTRMNRR